MEISIYTNTFANCENTSFSITFYIEKLHAIIKSFEGEVFRWIRSDIESISTILLTASNKTNSSTPIFCFLGDFLGLVGVLKSDGLDI